MGGNLLQQVPQRALSILDTLKKLEIQENKIKKIKEGDFEGESPLSVKYFYILKIFQSNLGLRNLDSLILAHNQLSEVPANVFRHLTLLNSLELEGNQISVIDKDAFAGLEGRCNDVQNQNERMQKLSFILFNNESFMIFMTTRSNINFLCMQIARAKDII